MKRRGAALPTAVALCSLLLLISFVVSSLIIEMAMLNKLTDVKSKSELLFNEAHNTFVSHEGDISTIVDNTYSWHTYNGEDNVKALVAYKKDSDSIVFYSIYDFDSGETLAYQTSVTYITKNSEGVLMLGGIVPMED